ncbi:MAG TPA: septal ring lytic transglycosylase RlpA family protein [Alphaproteobacteria bacterium]|nr:septal ring lytic transglycosylase RlpA family protein [Alphaproteobacteria bacterium]
MKRLLSILTATLVTCAGIGAAPLPNRPTPQASVRTKVSKVEPYQVGKASWYGKQFHGRTTASGEDFDMFELTAAHRQLPLGTYVKVTNLRNGRWIIVRVNDRGPYVTGRILDLSYSAARMLEFKAGVENVRIDLVQNKTLAIAQPYSGPN